MLHKVTVLALQRSIDVDARDGPAARPTQAQHAGVQFLHDAHVSVEAATLRVGSTVSTVVSRAFSSDVLCRSFFYICICMLMSYVES